MRIHELARRQLPVVQENDHRVHQNLVRLMDRRLSNVQLQQQIQQRYESDQASSCGSQSSLPRHPSIGQAESRSSTRRNSSVVHQPRSNSTDYAPGAKRPSVENPGYRYYGQANAQKRRRATLWETLAGLVCSLGALASRAAKMAARKGDSI